MMSEDQRIGNVWPLSSLPGDRVIQVKAQLTEVVCKILLYDGLHIHRPMTLDGCSVIQKFFWSLKKKKQQGRVEQVALSVHLKKYF